MEKKQKFSIGAGVFSHEGPMKTIYETVIFFDEEKGEYLVRFGEKQQLYFPEELLKTWGEKG